MDIIRSVAWLHKKNDRVLCVRTKGKNKFYIPGGKINQGEKLEEALMREIKEELGITLDKQSISPAIKIKADAHGRDDGAKVEMQCFFASYHGCIAIGSEIKELKWVSLDCLEDCAPAAQKAIRFLLAEREE